MAPSHESQKNNINRTDQCSTIERINVVQCCTVLQQSNPNKIGRISAENLNWCRIIIVPYWTLKPEEEHPVVLEEIHWVFFFCIEIANMFDTLLKMFSTHSIQWNRVSAPVITICKLFDNLTMKTRLLIVNDICPTTDVEDEKKQLLR